MAITHITDLDQMNELAAESIVTLSRPNDIIERWRKVDGSNEWLNLNVQGSSPLATRYFAGAVGSGYVAHVTDEDAEDPYRWEINSMWIYRDNPSQAVYVAIGEANQSNNVLTVEQSGRCSITTFAMRDVQRGFYRRTTREALPDWWFEGPTAKTLDTIASVLARGSVVEAVKKRAFETDDKALFGILAEGGVDMRIPVKVTVTGSTRFAAEYVRNNMVGSQVQISDDLFVPWQHEYVVRVDSKCLCDLTGDEWEKVTSRESLVNRLPGHEEFSVHIECPMGHDNKEK
jgi:hypothetical protein